MQFLLVKSLLFGKFTLKSIPNIGYTFTREW